MHRGMLNKLLAYAFILFLGIVAAGLLFPGVKVVVSNAGPGTMTDATLTVLGRAYTVDDVPPDGNAVIHVRMKGLSAVGVEYTNEQGDRVKLTSAEHRFNGLDGSVHVRIQDGRIEEESP